MDTNRGMFGQTAGAAANLQMDLLAFDLRKQTGLLRVPKRYNNNLGNGVIFSIYDLTTNANFLVWLCKSHVGLVSTVVGVWGALTLAGDWNGRKCSFRVLRSSPHAIS